MTITRRNFLASTAAATLMPNISIAQARRVLRARTGLQHIAPEGFPETDIWGYEGGVPGPVIRVPQGRKVSRKFFNDLPQGSSIHWHGIRIENAMDGVVGLTQEAVAPGDSFDYDFTVPDAGTYWYHPHNKTWEQMARGLYGALIVEESNPPEVDQDEIFLIDDWRLTQEAEIDESFGQLMDWSHGGRIGNWITVNGSAPGDHAVRQHERLRLRLVNVANSRIFNLEVEGLQGWVVALDGQPLDEPFTANQLTLAPAQRADLIVDVTAAAGEKGALVMHDRGNTFRLASFHVDGVARPSRLKESQSLPQNPVPALGDLQTARRVDLLMEGGAMGRMREAMMAGKMQSMSQLSSKGQFWAFNGAVGLPDVPLLEAEKGETIIIRIINDTAFPHAMHLHGFHFRKIEPNGEQGPLRDTLLVERDERAEIAFVADNPGDWLLHCHMLEHTAAGMQTWIKVI
ncbi:copper oxidase [Rhodobacterales bacterium 52_120_T64]|nr:copper oxidase [Rhodobacterales bacterium 52_120_T64]